MISSATEHEFGDVLVAANTPAYLYKRLRRNPVVQDLARSRTIEELIAEYERRRASRSSIAEIAGAYACLVAISLKPYDVARKALLSLTAEGLPATEALRHVALAKAVPFTSAIVNATPRASLETVPTLRNGSSTTSTTIEATPAPKVKTA